MKIIVIGASKGTGALAVENALKKSHFVSAFSRHPENLKLNHPHLTRVPGNFHDAASVEKAIAGHDAVIITASVSSLKQFNENENYFSQGTQYAIEAMKKLKVRKLVILSALGTGDSIQLSNFLVRALLVNFILKLPFADHARQEKMTMNNGLDWVIARPGKLTNGAARGKYVTTPNLEKVPMSISRADVADFLVRAAESTTWNQKAVQLGG